MDFLNESSTTVKTLIIVGALVIVGLVFALIASLSGGNEPDAPVAVATFTPTPVPAQLPAGPVVAAKTVVNVRLGPGTQYPVVGTLQQNQTAPIVGRSEDSTWYAISYPTNVSEQGWVAAEYVAAREAENVPVIAAPSLPEQEATPTAQPVPGAVITAPAEGQVGLPVVFSAEASTSASPLVRFAWSFGDGTVADAVVVEKTYNVPGVFLVNLMIVNDAGQEAQAQHQITISPAPVEEAPTEDGRERD